MTKYKTHHCILDLHSNRQEKGIIAEDWIVVDGRMVFHIGDRVVADLPYDKTFLVKVEPMDDNLAF